jgi:hypothetical protein
LKILAQWFLEEIFKEAIEAEIKMFYPILAPHKLWGK